MESLVTPGSGAEIEPGLASGLRTSAPDVPVALVSPESVSRLWALACRLPARFTAAFVECRLDPADRRVDLLACTMTAREKRSPDDVATAEPSGFAASVLQAWRTEGDAVHDLVPMVWLEYDDAARPTGPSAPSVCVCLERDYLSPRQFGPSRPEDWSAVCHAVLALPGCPPEASRSLTTLNSIFRNLPDRGRPIHLSVMCGRSPALAKLYARIPTADLRGFLARIGWNGNWSLVESFLLECPASTSMSFLDLSLTADGPLPQLGIAFPAPHEGDAFDAAVFRHAAGFTGEHAFAPLLQDSLGHWATDHPTIDTEGSWPIVVQRWVDQKIVFPAASRPHLKVYLGFQPLPLLFGAARSRS